MTGTTPLKGYQSLISIHLVPRLNFQTDFIQFFPLRLRTVSHEHLWNVFIILYSYITQQWDAKITVSQGLVLQLALYEDVKCPLSGDPGWSANEGESICAQPGRTDAATEGKCPASSPGLSRLVLWLIKHRKNSLLHWQVLYEIKYGCFSTQIFYTCLICIWRFFSFHLYLHGVLGGLGLMLFVVLCCCFVCLALLFVSLLY